MLRGQRLGPELLPRGGGEKLRGGENETRAEAFLPEPYKNDNPKWFFLYWKLPYSRPGTKMGAAQN